MFLNWKIPIGNQMVIPEGCFGYNISDGTLLFATTIVLSIKGLHVRCSKMV